MSKSGIRLVSETPGTGAVINRGDRVRVVYDIQLNRGEFVAQDEEMTVTVGDRDLIAGFRYGIEGMRAGGTRKFKASPHLCYRDIELEKIPKNAVLVVHIKKMDIVG